MMRSLFQLRIANMEMAISNRMITEILNALRRFSLLMVYAITSGQNCDKRDKDRSGKAQISLRTINVNGP
jgi:hypothetical protein